ncbi:hypothetical protein PR202_gb01376 [Eleusine coracana subsp. coracana]|uniref:Uncharacterized protein n=1 Tax=Eleusine coracana subsp. coracana TaxID=191504 RepID=A0AAV5DWI3_ELECO|nr:hypothetical protein PR202_gb01376 [Eleusine coracana subsp. coracana]
MEDEDDDDGSRRRGGRQRGYANFGSVANNDGDEDDDVFDTSLNALSGVSLFALLPVIVMGATADLSIAVEERRRWKSTGKISGEVPARARGLTVKVLFEATDHEDESDQLHKIFGVLGVPDKEAMKDMKPQDLDLAREVSKWRARRRGAGKLRSDSTLRKLVPSKVLSNDGFEVLQGLLTCNPRNRLTAVAALQLPWFANDDSSPGTAAIPKQIVTVGY